MNDIFQDLEILSGLRVFVFKFILVMHIHFSGVFFVNVCFAHVFFTSLYFVLSTREKLY